MVQTRSFRMIQWAIVVAIFVFLGRMVWDNWNQVKDASFRLKPFPFFLSTVIFAFSYFIQVWAWHFITQKVKIALSIKKTLESWFYSQLGKYLPGKIWLLFSRFYFYESKGKLKKAVSIALYLETVTVIIAGGIIFLAALILLKETRPFYSGRSFWWLIPLFIFAFASMHPKVLQKVLNWILFKLKKESFSLPISYSDVLWILLICILAWVIGGIGFYLFVQSVFPVSPSHILFLTGALAFSSTLGLIALFAPSGLGVREGVLVYLLSYLMPGPVAVVISVLTRIWMTLIEIGLIGVIYLLSQFRQGLKNKE